MGKDTRFKKGQSGNPNGKPVGAVNIINRTVKETLLDAFNTLQKDPTANIIAWGKKNPTPFYMIASKLLPTEIQASLTGRLEITRPTWFDEAAFNLLPSKASEETASN